MTEIRWEQYPLVGQHELARNWLQRQAHLQLAPNTVDAYGRCLNDYLGFCASHSVQPEAVTREQVALYVQDLAHRPNAKGANMLSIESGRGLANATMQQRITVLRLFCDSLIEQQLRQDNPVGRGHYVPGKAFGGMRDRGLLPHYHKLPWIPSDSQWQDLLRSLTEESLRNQVLLLLAYDGALRREELVTLEISDFDFAYHQIRIRAEHAELKRVMRRKPFQLCPSTKALLYRLLQPLQDVFTVTHLSPDICHETMRVMLVEMHRRGKTFWAWSQEEWLDIIGSSYSAFARRYGRRYGAGKQHPARRELPVLAYLLCTPRDLDPLLKPFAIAPIARKIFGNETIDSLVQQLTAILNRWGYEEKNHHDFIACLCYLLLRNHSPQLEALHAELLETVNQTCTFPCVRGYLFQISRALFARGIIRRPLPDPKRAARPVTSEIDGKIAAEWLSWCQRWREYSPTAGAAHSYYLLLKVGRWLNVYHPEVTSPADFTYEIAIEFTASVMNMNVGEWISAGRRSHLPNARIGQPLRPNAKARLLKCVRAFLRDCQEWGWIPVRLNPNRALQAPRSLRNLIGPDPRVVQRDQWAKLLWAAMNLEADDLPTTGSDIPVYPLELVRAIAVVWCFAALRSDEIVRLRVGCIRWQHEDVLVPATGELLPKDAVCFLDIPVNKTTTSYTKPVHPLVGKRINEWEHLRPPEQPRHIDGKTGEAVQFLFSYRGTRVSKGYLNRCLIPLLCRKANIPEEDSRGAITSHRARATIASMLYNAKEPLDIFQLRDYLGHKHLSSTQSYLKVDPTRLATQVAKAGYLEQNLATIEVLLDQDAVMSGAAARGECWKYYDLGHGWCTNPFWAECPHRMACARCPYYRPKDALKEQLTEGQANLVRMLEFVALTEDEKLLVTEGIELHQTLIEKLADVPTPAGPTPRELEVSRQPEKRVIPLKAVQRLKKKIQDEP